MCAGSHVVCVHSVVLHHIARVLPFLILSIVSVYKYSDHDYCTSVGVCVPTHVPTPPISVFISAACDVRRLT